MAQESCNVDKEEAEILKPSSSSSSSSPPPPTPLPCPSSSSPTPLSSSSSPSPLLLNAAQEFSLKRPERPEEEDRPEEPRPPSVRAGNRCSTCRKRVGLTGFRCRCGHLFCGRHRYSDVHKCSFDYKAMGRDEISKANPLVRAAKIIKI